ncbi:ubiquinone biosynthesis protein COQ4 [Novosphingobium huizhouense]|uniref:ubiquinone biosynthesis protein COQ4 n=1 Tax=Novosphingobium huizhouense TaxID=2866625 RepID=UPI001CD8E97F|nr:ubiquinone biosynthesis protein COQ4 [Novosphingobium huizhouense]
MSGTIQPDLPLYDERRPELKLRPLKAWHHFRELLKDKENTEEVFRIFESLPWRNLKPTALKFLESERGQQIRAREARLPLILDDHPRLRAMPEGSVAHAYCDFMEREGLTAQGLVDEFDKFAADKPKFDDQFVWYLNRMRDVHDLLHVLTGYGRDALGEACVLAFTYSQQPSPAHLFIGYMAGLNMKKQVKSDAPVLKAVREGQRLGKACPRLCEQSVLDLLPMPLEEARAKLNITRPVHYHAAHDAWRALGVDPYDLLGKNAKKAA